MEDRKYDLMLSEDAQEAIVMETALKRNAAAYLRLSKGYGDYDGNSKGGEQQYIQPETDYRAFSTG